MITKPANYDSLNENSTFKRLTMGGYVAVIKDVTDVEDKQYLEIAYDIAEGDCKGIGLDAYESFGRWTYNFRVYYTEKALWRFKRFITRVEQTNNGFVFDWGNPKCLVKKGVGLVIGMRQYYSSKDGSLREAPDVQDFCTANDVREGNLPKEPVTVEPKNAPPAPVMTEQTNYDDAELPF